MSIMGARGSDLFKDKHWNLMRKIISMAFLDPNLIVRLTRSLDDTCIGCLAKQKSGHIEISDKKDNICFERLGLELGTVIKFWDVVQLIEDKFSAEFIKEHNLIGGEFFDSFLKFVSRDAKLFANDIKK